MKHFTSTAYVIIEKVNEGGYGLTTKIRGIFNKESEANSEMENLKKMVTHRYPSFKVVLVEVCKPVCVVVSEVYE